MKIITIDNNRCVGCGNCEYACAFAQKQDCDRGNSNIRVNVYPEEGFCNPLVCFHCQEAWCMEICPTGAIKRDITTHAVVIDSRRCAGCKMCMLACPFGNIHFDVKSKVSMKCDLCGGDPNCVKYCISGALQFTDIDDIAGVKREYSDFKLLQNTGGRYR